MANHITCTWIGASGRQYLYAVHARHPKLAPNQPGNFIYAKMDNHGRWLPVYIGEGNLTQRASVDRAYAECIDAKKATHVHVHVNYDGDARVAEVKDLLANFLQVYAPDGCNVKGI